MLQLSRSVATCDSALAAKVLKNLSAIADAVKVVGEGKVTVLDQKVLGEFTVLIATDALSKEKGLATKADHSSKPRGGRVAMLNRPLKLWAPFSRKAVTVAIVRVDGVVADSPLDQAEALTAHWGKVFSRKGTCATTMQNFLETHAIPIDLRDVAMPTPGDIGVFLRSARYSAPGPDGIPYAAWRATGGIGTSNLHRVLCKMTAGRPLAAGFNDSLGIFLQRVRRMTTRRG